MLNGSWKKCYSFYIFPYTKVFDNLGQNDNQYHKEEAVSCQWSGYKVDAYTMANWVHRLINYTGGRNKEITGEELIELA